MAKLFIVGLIVLLINIPFGYWRANVKRFSGQWFLAVHVPVIFVIALRFGAHLGFAWTSYAVLVSAFFLGQQAGSLIRKRLSLICIHASSCLVMDLIRCRRH